jgi:hypothetical protein
MTTGAVLFAQNNGGVDYVKLAVYAAKRIQTYIDIPVSIITDSPDWLERQYPDHGFDHIINLSENVDASQKKMFYDGSLASKSLEWKNFSRGRIIDLTPYDRTLVIDSDFIINSSVLKPALDNDYDFQIYRNSMDLADYRSTTEFERISQWSVPFYWATVFIFNKNSITQSFFDLVSYIKSEWLYFKTLYGINSAIFRNDFAFSIAIHIMNGKTNGRFAIDLPGKMIYSTDRDILVNLEDNTMKFLIQKKNFLGEYTLLKTTGLDVHVMNKMSLSRYIDGGSGV